MRFQVVGEVPDLVEPIMARVARERRASVAPAARRRFAEPRHALLVRLARLAPVAAVVVGVIVGSLVMGGPFPRNEPGTVAAADVVAGVAGAAVRLDAYHATYRITEYGFDPNAPVREYAMNVWFHAPERFRMDVADHTPYPAGSGLVPNDLTIVVDGSRSYSAGPSGCPSGLAAACPQVRVLVRDRAPFSDRAPMQADLVVPVDTFAGAAGVQVVGRGTVRGRDAVAVRMSFERAAPLFPFLREGTWRPFFPHDRVVVWLDIARWFPLRYAVFPAPGAEQRQWALRFGLPEERPGHAVLEVAALTLDEHVPEPGVFWVPRLRGVRTEGAKPVAGADLQRIVGYRPTVPAWVDGLRPYRAVVTTPAAGGASPASLVTFARGLSWLKVGEQRNWNGDTLYGPVSLQAREARLGKGGVAYYEPAEGTLGRRLAIHAAGTDLYLETNLPRREFLDIAASLPVTGLPLPRAWRVREVPGGVIARVPPAAAFHQLGVPSRMPQHLPPGYAPASAELVTIDGRRGVNVYFQPLESDLGGGPIRLHVERADSLPPASSERQAAVEVGGAVGRWIPLRHQIEWVEAGLYRSLDAPGLSLRDLLSVARSMVGAP